LRFITRNSFTKPGAGTVTGRLQTPYREVPPEAGKAYSEHYVGKILENFVDDEKGVSIIDPLGGNKQMLMVM
jgi:hypothetical protein